MHRTDYLYSTLNSADDADGGVAAGAATWSGTRTPPPGNVQSMKSDRSKSSAAKGGKVKASGGKESSRKLRDGGAAASPSDFALPSIATAAAASGLAPRGASIVMDPLAVVRECIRYISDHPEHYGGNIAALLNGEVTYVMRLKASEDALLAPLEAALTTRPGAGDTFLPSLPGLDARALYNDASSRPGLHAMGGASKAGGLSGLASVALQAPSPALLAAIDTAAAQQRSGNYAALLSTGADALRGASFGASSAVATGLAALPETVQWDSPMTVDRPPLVRDSPHGAVQATLDAPTVSSRASTPTLQTGASPQERSDDSRPVGRGTAVGGRAVSCFCGSQPTPPPVDDVDFQQDRADLTEIPARRGTGRPSSLVVVDSAGYEATFLRSQLQQVEAAYNSKCVRLHELVEENRNLLAHLASADDAASRWQNSFHAVQGQLEVLRRELEGWRDRASDAVANASSQSNRRASLARRAQANQLNDSKQEVAKLNQLWRETERALQESRRAFENAQREATQSHDHLSDAFRYIERLERRVARRDAFMALTARRQTSLEEKYEKMMWCLREVGSLAGASSYADLLLLSDPLWTLALFVRLRRHLDGFALCEDASSMSADRLCLMGTGDNASHQGSGEKDGDVEELPAVFVASPGGGRLRDPWYRVRLVYDAVVNEVTGLDDRRGKVKRLRTNLLGSVGCRVLRWQTQFAVDFLGGEDNVPDSCELTRRKLPLLTLASVLLPLRNADGSLCAQTTDSASGETANAAAGATPSNGEAQLRTSALHATVPNACRYDRATIRFVLRTFWQERVLQFKRNMLTRVKASVAAHTRRTDRHRSSAQPLDELSEAELAAGRSADTREKKDVDSEEDECLGRQQLDAAQGETFLAALINFAQTRLDGAAGDGDGRLLPSSRVTGDDATAEPCARYVVRGVAGRAGDGLSGENGRMFFASVARAHGSEADAATAGHPPTLAGTTENSAVVSLSRKTVELLFAMYYYTMEFKDTDADFRLFYLVSHQLIPEAVGVNFFASIEAFHADCLTELQRPFLSPEDQGHCTTPSLAGRKVGQNASAVTRNDMFASSSLGMTEAVNSGSAAKNTSMPCTGAFTRIAASPMETLCHVIQLIDQTPLVGEEEVIEVDSDGEGFNSVLPGSDAATGASSRDSKAVRKGKKKRAGSASASTSTVAPSSANTRRPSVKTTEGTTEDRLHTVVPSLTASPCASDAQGRTSDGKTPAGAGAAGPDVEEVAPRKQPALVHNIRAYLAMLDEQKGTAPDAVASDSRLGSAHKEPHSPGEGQHPPSSPLGTKTAATGPLQEEPPQLDGTVEEMMTTGVARRNVYPEAWENLDREVRVAIGPHASLLQSFDTAAEEKEKFFAVQRRQRAEHSAQNSRLVASARGLLPQATVLAVLSKYLLTSFAVSCCGTPRFSLASTLIQWAVSGEGGDYLSPLTPVGQLPTTEEQLRRLRFAIALDHPAGLLRPSEVFGVDAHCAAPTHLYDELLTMTLDVAQKQQCFFMDVILRACASRHERFQSEGAEECDGNVPVALLRKGARKAFKELGLGVSEADALVEHLSMYVQLLQQEDEVKLEQFADAPFYVNSATDSSTKLNSPTEDMSRQRGKEREPNNGEADGGDGSWDFNDEAQLCSLLSLSLAVRMMYVVWGFDAPPEAISKLTETIAAIPLHTSFTAYRAQHPSTQRAGPTGQSAGTGVGKRASAFHAPASARRARSAAAPVAGSLLVADATVRQQCVHAEFEESTKAAYVQTLRRMSHATALFATPAHDTDSENEDGAASWSDPTPTPAEVLSLVRADTNPLRLGYLWRLFESLPAAGPSSQQELAEGEQGMEASSATRPSVVSLRKRQSSCAGQLAVLLGQLASSGPSAGDSLYPDTGDLLAQLRGKPTRTAGTDMSRSRGSSKSVTKGKRRESSVKQQKASSTKQLSTKGGRAKSTVSLSVSPSDVQDSKASAWRKPFGAVPNAALFSMAQLLGVPLVGDERVASTLLASTLQGSKKAKKKTKKTAPSEGPEAVNAAFAADSSSNAMNALRELQDLAAALLAPLQAEESILVALKAPVLSTSRGLPAPQEQASAPGSTLAKTTARDVTFASATADSVAGDGATAGVAPRRPTAAGGAAPSSISSWRSGGTAASYAFPVDWARSSARGTIDGEGYSSAGTVPVSRMTAGKACRGSIRPGTGRSIVAGHDADSIASGEAGDDAANTRQVNTLHVSLLHGACAALSLL